MEGRRDAFNFVVLTPDVWSFWINACLCLCHFEHILLLSWSPNSITPTFAELKLSSGESRGHKSWKSATWYVSRTFMICVRRLCRKVGVMEFGL